MRGADYLVEGGFEAVEMFVLLQLWGGGDTVKEGGDV